MTTSGDPLRVLMTSDAVGGVWTYALTLLDAIGPARIRCTLAITGPPPSAAALRGLGRLKHVSLAYQPYELEWMPGGMADLPETIGWINELVAREQPDVVHLNGYSAAAGRFERPLLVVAHSCVRSWWRAVHGTSAPSRWNAYRRAVQAGLRAANEVISPTVSMLRAIHDEYDFDTPATVIPNGARWEAAHTAKGPVIFAAGRIWDEAKNLQALEAVAGDLPWPVQIAGEATAPDGRAVDLRHAVHLGRLSHTDTLAAMAAASIYALPAKYEPFGLSVLEAAQQSCALVLGDIPTLREIWDGAACFVDPDDPVSLRQTIVELIEDDRRRETLAAAARCRARRFTAASMARDYFRTYQRLARLRQEISCAS
jgi:glycogen synthase